MHGAHNLDLGCQQIFKKQEAAEWILGRDKIGD